MSLITMPDWMTQPELRRQIALEGALRTYPQGAGNPNTVIAAAKLIEDYLRGELPPET